MRLINVRTFTLHEFNGRTPPYCILSHTWDGEEVSFQDFQNLEAAQELAGFGKIRFTCQQAELDGLEYAWVDTCCIGTSIQIPCCIPVANASGLTRQEQ